MKKFAFTIIALLISVVTINAASTIDSDSDTKNGRIVTTSGEDLFIGCRMHLSANVDKHNNPVSYNIVLDLTDRMTYANSGDCLTIHMANGNDIVLHNMFDTKADVTREEYIQTYTQPVTRYMTGFSPWCGFYGMPVTGYYTQHVPAVRTTTFARLYYKVTPAQLSEIANNKVKGISIVTNAETLNKKARPLSSAVAELYPTIMKYLDKTQG